MANAAIKAAKQRFSRMRSSLVVSCLSLRVTQLRIDLVPEQLVSGSHFVDRAAPMQHGQEMAGADGAALPDDLLADLARRSGDELLVADGEAAAGRWPIRHILFQPHVLRHEALQALGDGGSVGPRLALGRR